MMLSNVINPNYLAHRIIRKSPCVYDSKHISTSPQGNDVNIYICIIWLYIYIYTYKLGFSNHQQLIQNLFQRIPTESKIVGIHLINFSPPMFSIRNPMLASSHHLPSGLAVMTLMKDSPSASHNPCRIFPKPDRMIQTEVIAFLQRAGSHEKTAWGAKWNYEMVLL